MGFGTLFIGYFLLLNIVYPGFTNLIAALIMLLGLYKLRSINKPFRIAFYICIGFAVFSAGDLVYSALTLFTESLSDETAIAYLSFFRHFIIAMLTLSMLNGIGEVAREVSLEKIPKRSYYLTVATTVLYVLNMVMDLPVLSSLFAPQVTVVLYAIAIFGTFLVIILNLYVIYTCYARIGMPGENNARADKPSRFGFVNDYRRHKAEKEQEYAEYRMEKYKKKMQRKGRKK